MKAEVQETLDGALRVNIPYLFIMSTLYMYTRLVVYAY